MDNISKDNLIGKNDYLSQQNEITIKSSFKEKPKIES